MSLYDFSFWTGTNFISHFFLAFFFERDSICLLYITHFVNITVDSFSKQKLGFYVSYGIKLLEVWIVVRKM